MDVCKNQTKGGKPWKNRLESLMSLGNYGIVRLVKYSCILGKSANYSLILLESSCVENWRASHN